MLNFGRWWSTPTRVALEIAEDHYAELRRLIDDGGELTHAQALEALREWAHELEYQGQRISEMRVELESLQKSLRVVKAERDGLAGLAFELSEVYRGDDGVLRWSSNGEAVGKYHMHGVEELGNNV
jgi:hypothetical protein